MVVIITLLCIGTLATLSIENRLNIGEAYGLYTRRLRENVSYFWSNKILGNGWAQAVSYQGDTKSARSIPVLIYHGLPDEGGGENPFNSVNFSEHMRALSDAGWKTITLDEFEEFIRGKRQLPERSFLLTFDDGRKDTFYPSDPVLKDLGMHAVMFAITKKSTSPTSDQSSYYLSTYELGAMEKSEHWEVESHGRDSHDWYYIDGNGSVGHFFSNRLWLSEENRIETEKEFRDRIIYDLSNSKSDLERVFGKEVRALAYPFSDYGQDGTNYPQALNVVGEEVPKYYRLAFYQSWDGNGETFNYPSKEEVMMKRIEPLGGWDGKHLLNVLESGLSKDIPYNSLSFGDEWIGSWGEVSGGDEISLNATALTTGASAALNGSWWWRNYTFTTDVTWTAGSNVVLIGRRGDDDNYFGCNFGRNKVYIKTVVNGSSSNLEDADYQVPLSDKDINLGLSVRGSRIQCLVNHQVVLDLPNANRRIPNGGIGVEIWDARNGVAQASFDNVEVLAN